VELQNRLSMESNQRDIGKTFKVLIEGDSKKSLYDWKGRNSQNKIIVFPKENHQLNKGDYVLVYIDDCTQATLLGKIINPEESHINKMNLKKEKSGWTFNQSKIDLG
jgi:tRNA-2-methylthio-N6-dimethylallyladenosine synthase